MIKICVLISVYISLKFNVILFIDVFKKHSYPSILFLFSLYNVVPPFFITSQNNQFLLICHIPQ